MYSHILIPLENSPADDTVLQHVGKLAQKSGARVSLMHVADGYVARNYDQLKLAPSQEMLEDLEYLKKRQSELQNLNIVTAAHLAWGEPADEIIRFAEEIQCDLIATEYRTPTPDPQTPNSEPRTVRPSGSRTSTSGCSQGSVINAG